MWFSRNIRWISWLAIVAPATATAGWEEIYREDGIVVSIRENAGDSLPTFRGEGIIEASILDILAVFKDDQRHEEWMHSCAESTILEQYTELEALVYNRTTAPWPISDRDVVVYATLTFDLEKREAWNRFESVKSPLKGEVDDAVRMPVLKGFYHLLALDVDSTVLVYQVDADPGGWLPDWLTRMATKKLPLVTLQNLRRQVVATRGKYDDVIRGWIELYNLPDNLLVDRLRRREPLKAASPPG